MRCALAISLCSGLVKFSDLKGASGAGKVSKGGAVPDSLMTQREEPPSETQGQPAEPGGGEETEGKSLRRRGKKAAAGTGAGSEVGAGEEKSSRSRRQRDFDPSALDEDSDEERRASAPAQQKEKSSSPTAEDVWTQNQQKLLELALQQYPRGTTERWDRIAKVVPGKSKVGDVWPEQAKPIKVTELSCRK